jgi:hypothetical protein
MSDKLKQFIDENRRAFDSAEPDPQILKRLQGQMAGNSKIKYISRGLLKKTAVVAAVISLSVAAYFIFPKKKKAIEPFAIENSTEEIIDYGNPVYAKEIYHFKELIGLKQSELKKLEKEYPQLYQQFRGDINELDSSYQALKTNLSANLNREMLLEAMIQNLQLQSELLNRQLLIIKEIKQKSKRNEKTTI